MSNEMTMLGAAAVGLFGSTHCILMCGGIAGALSCTSDDAAEEGGARRFLMQLLYSTGRVGGYAAAGALVGSLGLAAVSWLGPGVGLALRITAALLLVAVGLYVGGWWHGAARIESMGARIWSRIAPAAQRLRLPMRTGDTFDLGAYAIRVEAADARGVSSVSLRSREPLDEAPVRILTWSHGRFVTVPTIDVGRTLHIHRHHHWRITPPRLCPRRGRRGQPEGGVAFAGSES